MISSMGCGSMASYDRRGGEEERGSRGDGTDGVQASGRSRRGEASCFCSARGSERRCGSPPCRADWVYLCDKETMQVHSMIPKK